ncbi:MAG TPA: CoA transferase [Candidatus Tectomicrobia bacterium]|nr:CoA transferase [Candidatus Tectomicrobia bacterium]
MPLPLAGLRILDLSRVLSGPYCTMLLADMGADVVKIEVPGEGDLTRGKGDPESEARGGQPVFFDLNRNKKSLTLNLKSESGKEIFKRLVASADVVVENYRPDVMDRLRLGYSVLSQINPRLIYCGISGFGKTGPYSLWPAYDQIAQGMSGLMSVTGNPDGTPMRVGVSIADAIAGLFAAYGVLLALACRQQTGRGQEVQANLLDGLISMLTARASNFLESGVLVPPVGNHLHDLGPAGTFETQDGHLNITAWPDEAFRRLCMAVEVGDLWTDSRFATPRLRATHRDALSNILNAKLRRRTTADWMSLLHRQRIPCGPIFDLQQVFSDPQVRHNGMVLEHDHPTAGHRRLLGFPVRLSEAPMDIRLPAPKLGEHTEEFLAGLGYSQTLIQELRRDGVI